MKRSNVDGPPAVLPRSYLKWLAVDLDGTIAEGIWTPEEPTSKVGNPMVYNVRKLKRLQTKGWKIVIHTARPWHDYETIETWLNFWEIPWDKIVCGKLLAAAYIDDRAINASDETWEPRSADAKEPSYPFTTSLSDGEKAAIAEEFLAENFDPPQSTVRGKVLSEAKHLIEGDRNNTYGPPNQDFDRSANQLNALGYRGPGGRELLSHDVAVMVIAVKLSRLMWTPAKRDSWVDLAGYAACGYECAVIEENERKGE